MILTVKNPKVNLELKNEKFKMDSESMNIMLSATELIEVGINTSNDILVADFGVITERDKTHEYYDGSYTVTPRTEAQVLETSDKIMQSDVDVKAIPTYEVDNDKGTTFYIGSKILWQ